jgi:hypothetical protein
MSLRPLLILQLPPRMVDGLVNDDRRREFRLGGLRCASQADRFGRLHAGILAQRPEDLRIVDDRAFLGPMVSMQGAGDLVVGDTGDGGVGFAFEHFVPSHLTEGVLDAFEPWECELIKGDVPDGFEFAEVLAGDDAIEGADGSAAPCFGSTALGSIGAVRVARAVLVVRVVLVVR